jgi:hypothetical protein
VWVDSGVQRRHWALSPPDASLASLTHSWVQVDVFEPDGQKCRMQWETVPGHHVFNSSSPSYSPVVFRYVPIRFWFAGISLPVTRLFRFGAAAPLRHRTTPPVEAACSSEFPTCDPYLQLECALPRPPQDHRCFSSVEWGCCASAERIYSVTASSTAY